MMKFRIFTTLKKSKKLKLFCWQASVFLLFITISGCARYHPRPIIKEAVQARLKTPDMDKVCTFAHEIKHPILHPIELNANEGLSPDSAAVIAVLLNPTLRSIREQRALSDAQIFEAGLLPNPELSYNLDMPVGSNKTGKVNAFGLGLDWNVTSLIIRSSKKREAKAKGASINLYIAWREWQVAQKAKAAIYQLSSLRSQIALFEPIHQQMGKNMAYIRKAVSDGFMKASDLNSVQAANSSVNERLIAIEKQADQQRLNLLRLMGLPADSQVHLNKNLRLPYKIILPKTSLVEGLEQRRLDLLALHRGYDSQDAAVRTAILEQFPRITIGPTISRDTDKLRTTGFGINIELPIFNHGQGRVSIEQATRKKLYDEYVNRIFEARSDIKRIESEIHFLNEQIAAARMTEVNLKRLVADYCKALNDGRTDAMIYYTRWNDLIGAQEKLIDLKGQLSQALVALELATGFYGIPGIKQLSNTALIKSNEDKKQ